MRILLIVVKCLVIDKVPLEEGTHLQKIRRLEGDMLRELSIVCLQDRGEAGKGILRSVGEMQPWNGDRERERERASVSARCKWNI